MWKPEFISTLRVPKTGQNFDLRLNLLNFEFKRRKSLIMQKSQDSVAPIFRAFLCLFDVKLQTLISFEGIVIF